MNTGSSDELISLARAGDEAALSQLVETAGPTIDRILAGHTRSHPQGTERAADASQVTAALRRRFQQFRGCTPAEWDNWAARVAHQVLNGQQDDGVDAETIGLSADTGARAAEEPAPTISFVASPSSSPPDVGPLGVGPTEAQLPARPVRLGNYELLEEIGRGGMGIVYKARQTDIDRIVAVKMIRESNLASDEDIERFYSEARAAGQLTHANIVTIHQVGKVAGHHYFSMDYVEGTNLSVPARARQVSAQQAAGYMSQISAAIHFAHEQGILHRDIKPANILIDTSGVPRITDFGLAKSIGVDLGLTESGTTIGTPSYMSPEQASGNTRLDRRSDVYSLGAVLYELLTGRPPFRNRSPMDTMMEVVHKEPKPPRDWNPTVDRNLETICSKCLQKDPDKRYQTAAELQDEFERYLRGEPILAKPQRWPLKCWYWLRDVPIVSALIGRRSLAPSPWQRRLQWMVLGGVLLLAIYTMSPRWLPQLPSQIRIATADRGGMYSHFAVAVRQRLAERTALPVQIVHTTGSVKNRDLLLGSQVEIAILQGSSVPLDGISVVAPLYYEPVHIIVRAGDRSLSKLADLQGRAISIGRVGSGMRASAIRLLEYCGIPMPPAGQADTSFVELATRNDLDAAIVTTGLHNESLSSLLASGEYRLLPIQDAQLVLKRPSLKPFIILPNDYPAVEGIPTEGLQTVASTALMTVLPETPHFLVLETLQCLYSLSELRQIRGMIGMRDAATWTTLPWHPTASEFYSR